MKCHMTSFVVTIVYLTISFLSNGVECNVRPECDKTFYTTSIQEGLVDGDLVFTVNCQDDDSGIDGEITYTLSDGGKGQFRVDSQTGSVLVEGDADAERLFGGTGQLANPYTLNIIVEDRASPPLSIPTTVFIDIISINDNTPRIEDLPTTVQVSETETAGKVLSTCNLIDDDVDNSNHGTPYVRIKSGNEDGKFVLNQINCDLMLISPLDFETKPSYTLTLEAYDLDPVNPRSSTEDLIIEVLDINDFTPACVGYNLIREVSESSPVATTLTTVECFDKDGGPNGQIEFNTTKGDPKLTVDKTSGNVSLIKPLDYEAGDDLLEMEVTVFDLGSPSLSATVTIVFKVTDADDNPPQWTKPFYNATISESTLIGSIVIALSATDLDTPNTDLSKITYGLEGICDPDWFLVDEQIGSVVVKEPLDWETSPLVECQVHAYSSDKFDDRTIANLSITLTDVNDRAPIFDKFLFTGSVSEDATIGTTVLRVEADDPDDGLNGMFVLSMPTASPFSIDADTGFVTLSSPIDYENVTNYLLTVVAKDKGRPTQTSLTYVNIQVDPVNEFNPTISAGISLSVSEVEEPGRALTKMSADDKDAGLDGEVEFFLLDSNVPFLLERATGDLRIGIGLDREIKDEYSLHILVKDKSNTTVRSSQSTIEVIVTDVNDNAPACDPIDVIQISPPISSQDPLVQIKCNDPDIGNTISYTLVGGDIHGIFDVNSQNGKVSLVGSPVIGSYNLYVDVEDNGAPNLKITIPIPIVVESLFKFDNLPASVDVLENRTIFSLIYTVNTSGNFDFSSSEIISGDEDKMFSLDPSSGRIRLLRLLDWETKKSYPLKIRSVSSNGQLIENDLTFNVIDINDNVPRFDETFVHIKVVEELFVPSLLKILTANDDDGGSNSKITYSIAHGNDAGVFSFENGELKLLKSLDYEKVTSYSLTVGAQDSGDPPLSSTAIVFVEVTNQDDNPLVIEFIDSVGNLDLQEDVAVGTLVTTVNGTDADIGSDIRYTFSSGNELMYFTINEKNGTIYTAMSLDYETAHNVSLLIKAENSIGVTKTLALKVHILDINDNTPTFSKQFYSTELPHGTSADKVIGQVKATDKDSGNDGLIYLSIINGNDKNHFRLSGKNLETSTELDSNDQDFYTLVIQAKDGGFPSRSSTTIFQIVVNEKLQEPQFASPFEDLTLQEDRSPGTVFDCDATIAGAVEGEQGDLIYSIMNGNNDNYFFIDSFTCKIDLVKTLDFSSFPAYSLHILAKNKADPGLNDSFVVNFNINQINKHKPYFGQEMYSWSIPENINPGVAVGTVDATDKDIGDFGEIVYNIETNSRFEINSSSGLVKTASSFDYRVEQSFHLYITAKDKGITISKSSSAIVVINIVDINDHIPAFGSANYEISLPETTSSPGDVFVISATDEDTGDSGEIQYSITSGDTSKFNIHASLGVVKLLKPLDFEETTEYILEIMAQDKGIPSLSSVTTLTVSVIDFNDHTPVIPFERLDLALPKNSPPFTSLYTITATDKDKGVEDSTVNYAILNGNTNGLFTIDIDTGEVKTARYVIASDVSYDLVVIARDQGTPSLTGSATIGIRIIPGSSLTPTDYSFSVEENKSTGTFVGQIPKDPNIDVTGYSISSGNFNSDLTVRMSKNGDGAIYTARPLDRESYSFYQLVVLMEHNAGSKSITVSVSVADINDNDPVAGATQMSLEVVENTPIGTYLVSITASDSDSGANGDIDFSISDSTPLGQKYFSIDSNGLLTVKEEIDFEIFTTLELTIEVTDKGSQPRTTSVAVSVKIQDVVEEEIPDDAIDDSPSTFKSFEIPHTLKYGDLVFTAQPGDFNLSLSVTDDVQYASIGSYVFALDSRSGRVTIGLDSLIYPSSSYLQWIVCSPSDSASKLAMMRIDTFDANENMIALIVSLDVDDLELKRESLINRLQTYFSSQNIVRIWAIQSTSSSSNRRRLLATPESAALVVVLSDDTSLNVGNVDQAKNFLSQNQLLAALQADPSGTPIPGLSDASIPVTQVVPYVTNESSDNEAHPASIAFYFIIALACIVVVVLIASLTAYFIVQHRKSKGSFMLKDKQSDEEQLCPTTEEDEQFLDQQERAFILMENSMPNARQLPPLDTGYGTQPFHSYRPPTRAIKTPVGLLRPVLVPPLDTENKEKPKRPSKSISRRSKKKSYINPPPHSFSNIDDAEVNGNTRSGERDKKKMIQSLEDEQAERSRQFLLNQEAEKKERVARMRAIARRKLSDAPRVIQPNELFKPKKVKNAWRGPKQTSFENTQENRHEMDKEGDGQTKSPYEEVFPRPYHDKLLEFHMTVSEGSDLNSQNDKMNRRKSAPGLES